MKKSKCLIVSAVLGILYSIYLLSYFGESGKGYIRIALTVGINKLKEAFDRLERN